MVGFFQEKTGDRPGYISLKQSELGESPPWAAELIIHQLVQFGFRAANAQMMEAVNRNDPTAYQDAYLLHEAQAEALPCRAASEMVNAGIALTRSGHQFAPLFVANNDLLTLGMGQKDREKYFERRLGASQGGSAGRLAACRADGASGRGSRMKKTIARNDRMTLGVGDKCLKRLATTGSRALAGVVGLVLGLGSPGIGAQGTAGYGDASPPQVKMPEHRPSRSFNDAIDAGELLAMLQTLVALPSQDLRDAEKIISLSRLPFREKPEHRDQHGIPRFFSITAIGENVETGTYWARYPVDLKRRRVLFTFSLNPQKFCLTRFDIEKVFGNVWLSGFLNDLMPDGVPQAREENHPHYGLIRYRLNDQRLLSFHFYNAKDCANSIHFQQGRDQ